MNLIGLEVQSIEYEVKEEFCLQIYFESADQFVEFRDVLSGYNTGIVGMKIVSIEQTKPNGLVFATKLKELSKEPEIYNRYLIKCELGGNFTAIELLAESMDYLPLDECEKFVKN